MPVVRSVRPSEIDRAAEIGAIAFESELEHWKKAFHEFVGRFDLDSMLVVEHEGRLVSAMLLMGEGMWLDGVEVPARAVAGVATVPEARRVGCAGQMMREATRRMKAWGVATSPMWPFSFVYYRKFGWEIGGEARWTVWPRDAAFQISGTGDIARVTAASGPEISAVWDAVSPGIRCATGRAPGHWARFLRTDRYGGDSDERGGLVCRRNGEAVGYIFYALAEPKEGEDRRVEIKEIRAFDAAAEVALIQALAERMPDCPKISASLPTRSRLRSVAVDPRAFETELHASFGFRVIDPAQILPLMRAEQGHPVRLRVEDGVLGTKTWETLLDGGPATATEAAPDVECTIQTFSQIASGFLKPNDAARAGLLVGDADAIRRLHNATATWTEPFRGGMEEG